MLWFRASPMLARGATERKRAEIGKRGAAKREARWHPLTLVRGPANGSSVPPLLNAAGSDARENAGKRAGG